MVQHEYESLKISIGLYGVRCIKKIMHTYLIGYNRVLCILEATQTVLTMVF